MKPPKLRDGVRYGFGPDGARVCLGANMGRHNRLPDDRGEAVKLRLYRLKWCDFDYDEGGAYWGHKPGTWIFRAIGDGAEISVEIFVRAKSRDEAKSAVRDIMKNAKFYR